MRFLKHIFVEKRLLQGGKYDTISKVKNCRPLPLERAEDAGGNFFRILKKQR